MKRFKLAAEIERAGASFLEAPVSGSVTGTIGDFGWGNQDVLE
ncbi:hypothetical protein [Thermicanus aegyptius]|nr:hypothetical protein [Thermicanus aegyptius]